MRIIFYVLVFTSLIQILLFFVANPILLEDGFILLDATSSGGHASSTGVSASTGGSPSSGGSTTSSGGGSCCGSSGGSSNTKETVIFISVPSVDVTLGNTGTMQLEWKERNMIKVTDVEIMSEKDYVQFDNLPIVVKTDSSFFTKDFSSGEFSYVIKDNVPYGVHQIPIVVTVNDGYRDYNARSLLTVDNTGIFFILETFRSVFNVPSVVFNPK